jgi:serine/threonine protein kinase
MPTKTVTRRHGKTPHKSNLITSKKRGGTVIGAGTFGAIMGNPMVPFIGPKIKSISRSSLKNKSGKTYKKTKTHNGTGKIRQWNYVSKLFFEEENIADVHKTIEILKKIGGNGFKTIFDRYMVLPVNIPMIGYEVQIDRDKYLSPEFQSNEYWSDPTKTSVDTNSREKLKDNTIEVIYPKALFDMNSIKLATFTDFDAFLRNFRNVVAGIQVLHKHGVVHHDLKPGNILVLGNKTDGRKQHYKISDLDSMEFCNNFTDELEAQASRLLNNWGYDYFPSCITLLASTIHAKSSGTGNSQIDSTIANIKISDGMKPSEFNSAEKIFNQSACERIQHETLLFIQQLQRVLPNMASKIRDILFEINRNKFGTLQLNDNDLSDGSTGFNPQKYQVLVDINSKIASILNSNRKLSLEDKHTILIKYVDIYSLGQSLLDMTKKYITTTSEVFSDGMYRKISDIFDFAAEILTYAYFDAELYNDDILGLYDERILNKSSASKSSGRRKLSSNSSVKLDAIFQ